MDDRTQQQSGDLIDAPEHDQVLRALREPMLAKEENYRYSVDALQALDSFSFHHLPIRHLRKELDHLGLGDGRLAALARGVFGLQPAA